MHFLLCKIHPFVYNKFNEKSAQRDANTAHWL